MNEQENKLKEMVSQDKTLEELCEIFKRTPEALRLKLKRLGVAVPESLKEVKTTATPQQTLPPLKATMEYHRTKDILHLMRMLGHKQIQNTLLYTQLITFESDEYHVKVAKTLEEACKLAEAGFDYFTTIEDTQIFRQRK